MESKDIFVKVGAYTGITDFFKALTVGFLQNLIINTYNGEINGFPISKYSQYFFNKVYL